MSQNEIIVDIEALNAVSESIKKYAKDYRESIQDAINGLKAIGQDWNDEDFDSLLSAISSFVEDLNGVEENTNQLVQRINNKIEAVRQLHSMNI